MSLPKLSIQVVFSLIGLGAVKVRQIQPKEVSNEHDAGERRKYSNLCWRDGILQSRCLFRRTTIISLLAGR